ncbi:hypothetical protein [Acanthopleuribacter pedis]|uniref:Uncharacterized protein n=1 Tax=Acanthopleuribacter pedis TaxID=442870 RepID=A0A8J7Q767_9BACT|nr:hypothetical protein [Acanthopleuribacter pedis]MBO1321862.1 hypothetical protein [Acanthopleuribacter pedis]
MKCFLCLTSFLFVLLTLAGTGDRRLNKGLKLIERNKLARAEIKINQAIIVLKKKKKHDKLTIAYLALGDIARLKKQFPQSFVYYDLARASASPQIRGQVNEKLRKVETEYWNIETAFAGKNWSTHQRFLEQNPGLLIADTIQKHIDSQQLQEIVQKDVLAEYIAFIKAFPNNRYKHRIKEKVYDYWRQGFDAEDHASAYLFFKAFQKQFPNSSLWHEAKTCALYHLALGTQEPEIFKAFYQRLLEYPTPFLSRQGTDILLQTLGQIAARKNDATAFYLLYEQTGKTHYRDLAHKYVKNAEEEALFILEQPEFFFKMLPPQAKALEGQHYRAQDHVSQAFDHTSEGVGRALIAAYSPRTITSAIPVFDVPLFSKSKFGSYRVTIEFTLRLRAKQETSGALSKLAKMLDPAKAQEMTRTWFERKTHIAEIDLSPGVVTPYQCTFEAIDAEDKQSLAGLISLATLRKPVAFTHRVVEATLISSHLKPMTNPVITDQFFDKTVSFDGFSEDVSRFRDRVIDRLEEGVEEGLVNILLYGQPEGPVRKQ